MKNIFLIETFPDGLKTIKSYLSDRNAKYTDFSSVKDAITSGVVPSMIILLANNNFEFFSKDIETVRKNLYFAKIPRIYLLPPRMSINRSSHKIIEGEFEFYLPVEKSMFISTVAECLHIPHRRVSRIIITIQSVESNLIYSGVSLDFSETGMGFECSFDSSQGHKINVSFVNPKSRNRCVLKAEIVRKISNKTGSTHFYGAKFIELSEQDNKELMSFIAGEK